MATFDAAAPRVGLVSFAVPGADHDELGTTLGRDRGIGVRTGLFCAHPPTRRLLTEATARVDPATKPPGAAIRASFGIGTRPEHVDRLRNPLCTLSDIDDQRPSPPSPLCSAYLYA